MTRHAMTLIEVLASLALLSALAVASVSWTTSIVRTAASHGSRASWETGATQVIDLIDRMLLAEDHRLLRGTGDRWLIAAGGDRLLLRTRAVTDSRGRTEIAAAAELRLEGGTLTVAFLNLSGTVLSTRPLLGELGDFAVGSEQSQDKGPRLTVRLIHTSGHTVARTWRPDREVQR
ncbi:MAG: prepilin-type N-terminal cleavage/methylation domain-containing protein [Phycisphaerales bacterium JB041]